MIKPDKITTIKENDRPISLVNIDTKTHNNISRSKTTINMNADTL